MLYNVPVHQVAINGLTIEGYSRAAVQTYWRIPEMKIGFDLGAHPWDFMGVPTWLISHCHLDHIAALPVYLARRRMMNMEPPRVLVPDYMLEPIKQMLRGFVALDRGKLPCRLVPLVAGDRVELSRELVVEALAVDHRVPALGFVVYERRKKLRPELAGCSEAEIRDRRLAGEDVTYTIFKPLVGYTGDTSPLGLDRNPVFYECRVLISEMTFLTDEHTLEFVHRHGHMHLDDYVARRDRFQNEVVICSHLSSRYARKEAHQIVKQRLPCELGGRLRLLV